MPDRSSSYSLPDELEVLFSTHESGDVLRNMWEVSGHLERTAPDERKSDVRFAVLQAARPRVRHLRLVSRHIFRFSAAAAVLALAVATSFLLGPQAYVLRSDRGIAATVHTLPDGSTVTLAPGSRISFDASFRADGDRVRQVHLRGRAFFDVETTGTPFEVHTFNTVTHVLGTTFSVEAWPGEIDAGSEVIVSSGRVAVSSGATDRELAPGEGLRVPEGAATAIPVPDLNVDRSLSWRSGGLAYENEPIGNVLRDLERRFDITLSAPASIRLRRISYWKQHASDASEVVGDVAATVGIRYRSVKDGFELYLP